MRGDPGVFSLESRIFHAICIISLPVILISAVMNLVIGMPELAFYMLVVALVIAGQLYLSRVHKKFTASIVLFSILSNVLLITNFYYNSGIKGPTLIIFLLSIFLTIAIVPKRQYLFWIAVNLTSVLGLLVFSYRNSSLIEYTYLNDLARYTDLGYSYILVAVIIFLVTAYIRSSYNKEKELTEQRATELRVSNETKNKLLSILAHDLRSPLSSIQNYLELLSEFDMTENEKVAIRSMLLTETKSTQQMLSNLLSWSKSQMEGMSVNMRPLNVHETLAPALRAQEAMATGKLIQLENKILPSAWVLGDTDMLQLVVRNLVNNAIKFTLAGGTITVSSTTSGNQCIIMVTDTGSGIPEDQQKELFSLKARSTFGTQNEKGVGLGLALCKEFTEIQNGKIWFESRSGKGTTFFISLEKHSDQSAPDIRRNVLIEG